MNRETPDACLRDGSGHEWEKRRLQARMGNIGHKIIVLSGKGGVGKSTVAANLAVSLAEAGHSVGLLDVDLHGPSIPKLLGLDGHRLERNAAGAMVPIPAGKNLSVVSAGLLLDSANDAVIWRGPKKYNVIRQFLGDVEWGRLDYLVIDCPPGTGDEPLAVAQSIGSGAWALVVTTPQDLAVADVRRSVSFCKTLELRIAGIIENMSGLPCLHCGKPVDPFKTGGGERLATEVGAPFLGRIPLDPLISASGDEGMPFARGVSGSPSANAFACAVETLMNLAENNASPSVKKPYPKETPTMKIAIPMANGQLCMHFGHCEQFALVDVDEADRAIVATRYLTPPAHEPGVLPRWLHEQGANVIISGGMGQRAQGLFADSGIEVVVGAPAGAPEDIVTAYLAGTLEAGQNVCDH